jgi:hypothetical protein
MAEKPNPLEREFRHWTKGQESSFPRLRHSNGHFEIIHPKQGIDFYFILLRNKINKT